MIGFNTFLESEGISPAEVKLVRHQDNRRPGSPTPYQLWRAADGRLDLYQQIQRRPVFKGARLLASFVATLLNETLFIGNIRGQGRRHRSRWPTRPNYGPGRWGPAFIRLGNQSKARGLSRAARD
jgi:hypothetical protein